MTTEHAPILAPPSAPAEHAVRFILSRGSAYTDHDIRVIVGYYWTYAIPVGIDPVLAVAQCIHETSSPFFRGQPWRPLSAFWALRPRRNPAGIGVTGETKNETEWAQHPPNNLHEWQFNWATKTWERGVSFPSWDVAVRAHLGRLLCYATGDVSDGLRLPLMREALKWRPLASHLLGTAPTLRQLGAAHNPTGQGWAAPGHDYGMRIAQIATAIQRTEVS